MIKIRVTMETREPRRGSVAESAPCDLKRIKRHLRFVGAFLFVLNDGRLTQIEDKSTDLKVVEVANERNLKRFGSEREPREAGRKGGKASGAARRRKADFRKTLNLLLTTEIDNSEWTPLLQALGLDSTLESAVNMAMIKEALSGNVKAYIAIRDTIGQTTKSDKDLNEQDERIRSMKLDSEEKQQKKARNEENSGLSDIIEEAFAEKE